MTPSLLLLSKTSKNINTYINASSFAKVCVKWVPQYLAKYKNSVHGNLHIMMWNKKNFCPGLSRGDKTWRQRQSTEWHHYTFHRINNAVVARTTVTMFSVSRIQFSGCNAERTDNTCIQTDKTPRVFSKFQLKDM